VYHGMVTLDGTFYELPVCNETASRLRLLPPSAIVAQVSSSELKVIC